MKAFRADLHIHTVLSPCGSLEMSPEQIIKSAIEKGLDIIGIADHNSTRQSRIIKEYGKQNDVFVLCGAEVNTKEEVHCLAFFETENQLDEFQNYLDQHLPYIQNKPELFGDQVWVDLEGNILGEEDRLLIVGIDQSIDEVAGKVEALDGIFIPAHVDRPRYSISSQLGFISPDLKVSALEVSRVSHLQEVLKKYSWIKDYPVLTNSDAHVPEDIGAGYSTFLLEELSFKEIKKALYNEDGRKILNISLKF